MKNGKDRQVSPSFALTLAAVVLIVTVVLFVRESRRIQNFEPVTGQATHVRVAPRQRLVTIQFEAGGKAHASTVSLGTFQSVEVGDDIDILFNPNDKSEIVVDSMICRHQASIPILLGSAFLGAIVFFAMRRNRAAKSGSRKSGAR